MPSIRTPHGDVALPAFFPDATRAVVRSLDAADLEACGVPGLVVCAFHLARRPGSKAVAAMGGVHRLMGWQRPVITDSGGFQVFSLIRQNPKLGTLTRREAIFRLAEGGKAGRLSPEKSIQVQLRLGADILVCLDDCTHPTAPRDEQAASVARTIAWAERCKAEFERGVSRRSSPEAVRPLLFAVIQGGADAELRRLCARELVAMGFDGYGFGGWPFDAHGRLLDDILALTADLMPCDRPRYALGLGSPGALVACARMGYTLFDCALPTRDARRGRLYVFGTQGDLSYDRLYLRDAAHRRDRGPVSDACDCLCCRAYSRAYLHHLFAIGDSLAWRLATVHNLRFYAMLMGRLRNSERPQQFGR
ncbi:MAG TPA: tRNA guanosine(34) transglycosylase Tgt [Planctomycetota bacterium]|nr:tRNA guanosine(34) transglycosylase Tgt [Planctomycetota bacterium]HRR78892.1 tRNA guanosine(34) transglycosylase Tgt [Planctomycetota bacterium]HRT93905.1 tRNA guanosine(34) transglycosylase Tgt [Planctomycetota bacterium]